MNFLLFSRILFFPLLFPLSIAYGFFAFIYRIFSSLFPYKSKAIVLSVGNFCVGGSGKTPIVIETAKFLKAKGFPPVVVTKSYKASLKKSAEVQKESLPSVYGDEAVLLKESLGNVPVVSGPVKKDSVKFYDESTEFDPKRIYILDDGAQHHKIYKNLKIHVWDMSRTLFDIFPFPLGASREFWFFGEIPTFSILNRYRAKSLTESLVRGDVIKASYEVKSIRNIKTGDEISSDFTLISGLGNFEQLQNSVMCFTDKKPYKIKKTIKGRDHDDFSWFKPSPGAVYVCTLKDKAKLVGKISSESLYIVESGYNEAFKEELQQALDRAIKEIL